MNKICPICIITAQSDREFEIFKAKIDRQFKAFAKQEFGKSFDFNKQKWWTILNIEGLDIKEFDGDFLKKSDLSILKSIAGLYDARRFVFIYVGSENDYYQLIEFVDKINGLQSNGTILGGITDVFHYGICHFSSTKPQKQKIARLNNSADKFDVLVFLNDTNFHPVKNPNGYRDLNTSIDNKEVILDIEKVFDNLVQLVFHIGLTINVLFKSKEQVAKVLMTAGSYTLTFEPEVHKHNVANALLLQIFPKFCIEKTQKLWSDDSFANQYFNSIDIVSKWGWNATYKFFIDGFETNDEVKTRNKEICKLLYKPSISPWSLFSQWVIPVYFRKYIRSLVANLRESSHSFMFSTIFGFNNHLNKQNQALINGSSYNSIDAVGKLLKNVWAENNSLENPVGIQQILLVLEKVSIFIESQIVVIDDLKDNKPPAGTDFPLLENYPLKSIPKSIHKFYVDFAQNEAEKKELNLKKDENNSYEQTTLTKIVKLLQFHPVPLSLFTRATILGIVLPIVLLAGLILIPDVVINTSYFESGQGIVILFVSFFAVCMLVAFFKFWLGVLQKIKRKIKKYLAWIFWKTQQKLFNNTLNQQLKYYHELSSECSRIKQNITDFICPIAANTDPELADPTFENLKATLFSEAESEFAQGMFQRDILGKFDNEWTILNNNRVNIHISFNKAKYTLNSLSDENTKALLFKSLFIEPGINPLPIYQLLFDKVIANKVKVGDETTNFDTIREEVCAMLLAELKERISLENADSIQKLIFEHAPIDTGNNFNKNHNDIPINKLIQSRYFPSVLLKSSTPYSQLSFIIPEDTAYNEDKWKKALGNNHKPENIHNRKSLVSIMQTFSLNGLTDIFDKQKDQTNNNQ